MTLAAVSLPYYKHIMPYRLAKFVRFAKNVWDVDAAGKTEEQVASEGLTAMENWMKELGLVLNITELGATEDMIPDLVKGTIVLPGGYKVLLVPMICYSNMSKISVVERMRKAE